MFSRVVVALLRPGSGRCTPMCQTSPAAWNNVGRTSWRRRRRYLSDEKSASDRAALDTATKDISETTMVHSGGVTPKIQRHGPGDSITELNVGGKSFYTLRSTLEVNDVLFKHVTMAERNQEFIKGAIFIDRDPAHFSLILQHLRNKAEGLQGQKSVGKFLKTGKAASSVTIQIPKDIQARRDLFMEARYFQIKEIEVVLCRYDMFTWLASLVGGGAANPFTQFTEIMKTTRRLLLATGGTSIFMGTMNEDLRKDVAKVWHDLKNLYSGEKPEEKEETIERLPEPSLS